MPDFCGKCGQLIPPPAALFENAPVRRRIYEAISRRPDGISRADVIAFVYGWQACGGPDSADTVVSVLVNKINRKLASLGTRIVSTRGPGAVYKLVKL